MNFRKNSAGIGSRGFPYHAGLAFCLFFFYYFVLLVNFCFVLFFSWLWLNVWRVSEITPCRNSKSAETHWPREGKELKRFLHLPNTEVLAGKQMTCEYEKDLSTFFFFRWEREGAKARQENPIWHQPTSTFVWNKISPISPRLIFISGIPPLGLFFSWSSKFWKRWNKEVFIGNRLLATASDLQPANEALLPFYCIGLWRHLPFLRPNAY